MPNIKPIQKPPMPYVVTDTIPCPECGGRGYDWGEQFEYEPCRECLGSGTFEHTHNLLKEAFHIANANGHTLEQPEYRHLQALVQHFREFVSTLMVTMDTEQPLSRRPAAEMPTQKFQEVS